ncbi:MAG: 50S ribosomal protein L29 [Patescibacteria group bacterium]
MKRRDLLTELRAKDQTSLVADLKAAEKKLLELQFGVTLRKIKKTDEIRATRKLIARLQTLLREHLTRQILEQIQLVTAAAVKE